ncbi:MAG TPA: hemerythrin domain-containing protein [Pyrinomonadaceae bacterium]|nr:hemerythrin domain-containing protein [Pyrinomonadaceae bacterium]
MNAIDLLKEDHKIVDGLFKEVESTPPSKHGPLFKRIKGELDTHAHVEEAIFYPTLKKKGDKELKEMVLEGIEEHHQMKMFLREVAELTPRNERFEPKLMVLIEDTRHHVKEEEGTGGMFSMAENQLGEEAMEKLGKQILAEKARFIKDNGIKPEPRPAPTALGSIAERAKEMVAGVLGGGSGDGGGRSRTKTANGNGGSRRASDRAGKTTSGKPTAGKSSGSKSSQASGPSRQKGGASKSR